MYFNKKRRKKADQIYLWNLYHISDLILQQIHGKSQIHTQKTRTLTHRLKKHTHSRTSFLYESLWNASEREREDKK